MADGEDPFEELRSDDDVAGLSEEDLEAVLDDDVGTPENVVEDPEELEEASGEGPSNVSFRLNTGKFRNGQPLQVDVTLSIPDNALDVAAQFISYQTKARAELMLWDHFVEEPEWLVEPERHGIYYEGDGFLVHPSKLDEETQSEKIAEYEQAFTESEIERHEEKLLPRPLRQRLTEKIQLAAGVDGDFIEDRLAQMPPDVVQRAARLSSRSQKQQDSPQSGSKGGAPETAPSSTST